MFNLDDYDFLDADTLKHKSTGEKIRISDYDAYETFKPKHPQKAYDLRGDLSTRIAEQTAVHGVLTTSDNGDKKDTYNRSFGKLITADGKSVGDSLIDVGLAFPTSKDSVQRKLGRDISRGVGDSTLTSDEEISALEALILREKTFNRGIELNIPTTSDYKIDNKYEVGGDSGNVSRAVDRGWEQTKASIGAAGHAVGHAIGNDSLVEWGNNYQSEKSLEASLYDRDSRNLQAIFEDDSTSVLEKTSEAVTWAIESGFEETIPMAIDLSIAAALAPIGGAGAGYLATKHLAKRGVQKSISRYLDDKLAAKAIDKYVDGKKITGAKRFAQAGLLGSQLPQSVGEAEMTAQELGLESGGFASIFTGLVTAGIDTTADWLLVGKLLKARGLPDDVSKSIAGRAKQIAKDGASQAGIEGVTELIQDATNITSAVLQGGDISKIAPDGDWGTALAWRLGEAAAAGSVVGGATGATGSTIGQLLGLYEDQQLTAGHTQKAFDELGGGELGGEVENAEVVQQNIPQPETMPNAFESEVIPPISGEEETSDELGFSDSADTGTDPLNPDLPSTKESINAAPSVSGIPLSSRIQTLDNQQFMTEFNSLSLDEQQQTMSVLEDEAARIVTNNPQLETTYERSKQFTPSVSATKIFPMVGDQAGDSSDHTSLADYIADDPIITDRAIDILVDTLPADVQETEKANLSTFTAIEFSKFLKDLAPADFNYLAAELSAGKNQVSLDNTNKLNLALQQATVNKTKFTTVRQVREAVTTSLIQNRPNSAAAQTAMRQTVINGTESDITEMLQNEGVKHAPILAKVIHSAKSTTADSDIEIVPDEKAAVDEAMQSNFFLHHQTGVIDGEYHGESQTTPARLHKFITENTGRYDSLADNIEVANRNQSDNRQSVFDLHDAIPKQPISTGDVDGGNQKMAAVRDFGMELAKVAELPDNNQTLFELANGDRQSLVEYIHKNAIVDPVDDTETMEQQVGIELTTRDTSEYSDEPFFSEKTTFSTGMDVSDVSESEQRNISFQQQREVDDIKQTVEIGLNRELNELESKLLPKLLRDLTFKDTAKKILSVLDTDKPLSMDEQLDFYRQLTGERPDIKYSTDLTPILRYLASSVNTLDTTIDKSGTSPFAQYEQNHGETVSETMHKIFAEEHFYNQLLRKLANLKGSKVRPSSSLVRKLIPNNRSKQHKEAIKLYRSMRESMDGEVNEFKTDEQFYTDYVDELYNLLSESELKKYHLLDSRKLGKGDKTGFRGLPSWAEFFKASDAESTIGKIGYSAGRQIRLNSEALSALLPDAPRGKKGRDYENQLFEAINDGSLTDFIQRNNIGYQSEYEPTLALSTGYSNNVNRSFLRDDETPNDRTPTVDLTIATSNRESETKQVKLPALIASIMYDAKTVISQPDNFDILQGFYAAVDALQTYTSPDGHSSINVNLSLDSLPDDMVLWHDGRNDVRTVKEIRAVANARQDIQSTINDSSRKQRGLESSHSGVGFIADLMVWQARFEAMLPHLKLYYGGVKDKTPVTEVGKVDTTANVADTVNKLLEFIDTTIENNRYKYGLGHSDFYQLQAIAKKEGEITQAGDQLPELDAHLTQYNNKGLDLSLFADNPTEFSPESVTQLYRDVKHAVSNMRSSDLSDLVSDTHTVIGTFHALQALSHEAYRQHQLIMDTNQKGAVDSFLNDHVETSADVQQAEVKDERDHRNARLSGDRFGSAQSTAAIDPKPSVVNTLNQTQADIIPLRKAQLDGVALTQVVSPYTQSVSEGMDSKDREPIFNAISEEKAAEQLAKYSDLVNSQPDQLPTDNKTPVRTESQVVASVDNDSDLLAGVKNPFSKFASDLMATINSTTPIKILTGKMSANDKKRFGKDFNETLAGSSDAFSMVRDGTLLVYIPFDKNNPRNSLEPGMLKLGHEIGHYLLTEASQSPHFKAMEQEYQDENPDVEFNEWFADKVAKALIEKKEQQYGTAVFLRKIGDQLLALYRSVTFAIHKAAQLLGRRTYFTQSQPFSDFIDDIFNSNKPRNFNFAEGKKAEYFNNIPKKPLAVIATRMKKLGTKLAASLQWQAGKIDPKFRTLIEDYTKLRRVIHSNINGASIKPVKNRRTVDKGYADWLLGNDSDEQKALSEWFGNIKNYFHGDIKNQFSFLDSELFSQPPLRFNTANLEKNKELFIKTITPALKDVFGRDNTRILRFIENLLDANGYVSLAHHSSLTDDLLGLTPPRTNELNRKILTDKKLIKDLIDNGFIDTNGVSVTQTYISQLAAFSAYGAVFGGRPVLSPTYYHSSMKLQSIYQNLQDDESRQHFLHLHDALTGRLNRTMPYKLRTVQSYAITTSNMSILAFAGIASLPDIATPMIKTYSLSTTLKGLKHLALNPRVMYSIAKALGTVSSQYMQQNLTQLYSNGEIAAGLPRIASDIFFKLNLQTTVNNINQWVGSAMGTAMIEEIHLNPNSPLSKRLIAEYDMDMELIDRHFKGKEDPFAHRHYDDVMTRFLTNTQMMGERAYRSPLAQNPWALMATNLKNFPYDYAETVLFPVFNESKARWKDGQVISAMLPVVFAAALLMPFAALGMELREWLRDGKSPRDLPTPEYLAKVMQRTGVLTYAEIIMPLYYADKYHNPYITAMIPTLGMGYDVIKADEWGQKGKRIAPFINQGVPFRWNPFE